jgi:hypothetical protein
VRKIFGVKNGYRGFYSENMIDLNMEVVDGIQHKGGTMLGTSRGGSDINKMVDSIEARGINQVGTFRERSGNVQEAFRERSGSIQGSEAPRPACGISSSVG